MINLEGAKERRNKRSNVNKRDDERVQKRDKTRGNAHINSKARGDGQIMTRMQSNQIKCSK